MESREIIKTDEQLAAEAKAAEAAKAAALRVAEKAAEIDAAAVKKNEKGPVDDGTGSGNE
jgi:hypothetical protein